MQIIKGDFCEFSQNEDYLLCYQQMNWPIRNTNFFLIRLFPLYFCLRYLLFPPKFYGDASIYKFVSHTQALKHIGMGG